MEVVAFSNVVSSSGVTLDSDEPRRRPVRARRRLKMLVNWPAVGLFDAPPANYRTSSNDIIQ